MGDIFSADGGSDQYLSWNARDHYFSVAGASINPLELYLDALSFRAGWANLDSDPKPFRVWPSARRNLGATRRRLQKRLARRCACAGLWRYDV